MANNRMYITCLHCLNDEITPIEDCQFYLAKYYPPPSGWYTVGGDGMPLRLDEFFSKHQHKGSWNQSMYGDHFTIITETLLAGAGDEMAKGKREIMDIVTRAAEEGKVGR